MTELVHTKIEAFDELDDPKLEATMEYFGVDLDPEKKYTKANKRAGQIEALEDNGIKVEMYNDFMVPREEDEDELDEEPVPEPVAKKRGRPSKVTVQDEVLLKMERANPHYEIYGYTFTKSHPFQVVTAEAANYIIQTQEGFRTASPAEVQEYYS